MNPSRTPSARQPVLLSLGFALVLFWATSALAVSNAELISGKPQRLPVPGMATMVEIGAKKCIPCKLMAPIIAELSREYEGRAAIAFIDVWKHPDEIKKFNVEVIPTQIFFDQAGNEYTRHTGFLKKESIVEILKKLGVE